MRVHVTRTDADELDVRLCQRLRRRLLRATLPAVEQLARTAAGEYRFPDDHALRACVALARLVPVLVARQQVDEPDPRMYASPIHPDRLHDADNIIARMQQLREEALAERARERERKAADAAAAAAAGGVTRADPDADTGAGKF